MKILEASPGFGRPLNEQETKDFLTAGKLNVHLGTVDEKGDANIHPAWYYYDLPTNKIYIETSKQAKKTYNLRNKENVYFCIDEPNPPYKGARGKGTVKIHEDVNFNIPIAEKIMVKYLANLEHPMAKALLDLQKKGQSVVIEISPKCYSTWDYSKQ
ncbi:MAG: pyridoxamine 5'-phosphate oxidase family protein [Nitrososphaeraceae archaeon]